VLPGEAVMEGHDSGYDSDVEVSIGPWKREVLDIYLRAWTEQDPELITTSFTPGAAQPGSWTTTAPRIPNSPVPPSRSHQCWKPNSWRQYGRPCRVMMRSATTTKPYKPKGGAQRDSDCSCRT
jgi:hypothetical protein